MLDNFNAAVPSLTSLVILGGAFLVVVYMDSRSKILPSPELKYDKILMSRLNELGIVSFVSLQQKANLTTSQIQQVRNGNLALLQIKELMRLAKALDWTIEELLEKFEIADISSNIALLESEIEELRQECLRLYEALQNQGMELTTDLNYATFHKLQTLLTSYPSVQQLVSMKPNVLAKNLIPLFSPLNNLIESWGYEQIGQVWEQVPYNPQLHQTDINDIKPGEMVYIRFVGYRDGEKILCPAKVSRNLPTIIQN
jgi:DNA-binding Xre family transcriptional regulator